MLGGLSAFCILAACNSATPTPLPLPTANPQAAPPTPTTVVAPPTAAVVPAAPLLTPTAAAADLPGREQPDEGANHVAVGTLVNYKNSPPSSGAHYPQWANYGVYLQAVPAGFWIHNLEHGAVVLLFKCESNCQSVAEQAQKTVQTLPPGKYGQVKLVATPYNAMPRNFAVVAWGRVDDFDTLDAERIKKFYIAFVDKGPEDVP